MRCSALNFGLFRSSNLFYRVLIIYLCFSTQILTAASRAPVWGDRGLVAAVSPVAAEAGASILRQGGNAADAAVAVAFALAVSWPSAGNLGGGGFALVRTSQGAANFIDYRETAPAASSKDFYLDAKGQIIPDASTIGYRAVGVPGTVAGMALMHKKYGKLAWAKVIEPAYLLAKQGFKLDESYIAALENGRELLEKFPESRRIFLRDGKRIKAGDIFQQAELASSIALIQKGGADAFYKGELAHRLVQGIQKSGGVISLDDLAQYKVIERSPLGAHYKDYEILTVAPPSSGGPLLLAMLGMLEKDDLSSLGFGSAQYLHRLIETMKRCFADRSEWFGDPGFVNNPIAELLKPDYLLQRRQSIDPKLATPSALIKPGTFDSKESHETTHFTVVDAQGMIVSNTYTLNGSFGSGATALGTGILLNNEMDDFTSKPGLPNMYGLVQNARNAIAPGKRPLSSMSPTIFLKNGKPVLALGSPGGPTIINSVLQVSLNVLEFGMDIQTAIDAPKIHHQWQPDRIRWEPFGINPDTRLILEGMGHIFNDKPSFFGDVQAVYYDQKRQQWSGGSDSRHGGIVAAE